MKPETITTFLWASGFVCKLALVGVLISTRNVRRHPWFSTWAVFGICAEIILFFALPRCSGHTYFLLYWTCAIVDLLLQLSITGEIARNVLRRGESWSPGSRTALLRLSGLAMLIAVTVALLANPSAISVADRIYARANLFMTILFCLVFGSIMSVSKRHGLAWEPTGARIGYGFTFWILSSFALDTIHAANGSIHLFDLLEYVRSILIQSVTIYWSIIQLLPNSKRPRPELTRTEGILFEEVRAVRQTPFTGVATQ